MVCVPGGKRMSQFRHIRTSAPDLVYDARQAKEREARSASKERVRFGRRRRAAVAA
jgi:hypothetical protein